MAHDTYCSLPRIPCNYLQKCGKISCEYEISCKHLCDNRAENNLIEVY